MEFPDARLLIFAKAPIPGQVKTRLAKQYGYRGAAKLYKILLHRTLYLVTTANLCPVQLWCSPNIRHSFFLGCRRDYGVELRVQRGDNLGRRMDHALTIALRESKQAILIGGDVASLDGNYLHDALSALAAGKDVVVGPSEDGGYVLIGMSQPYPTIFNNISWGGNRVMSMTRRRLQQARLTWQELPLGWDVDYPADVRRLQRPPLPTLSPKGARVNWVDA